MDKNIDPLISVIVPCYNQAQYLDECLQSVLNQTYHNWECIIVNDGSSDNTEQIVKRWLEKDARFKYHYQENAGVSAARNNGIALTLGTYILPLDADDKIAEIYLQKASRVLEQNSNISIVYGAVELFGETKAPWQLPPFTMEAMLCANIIYSCAMYRRADYEKTLGYDRSRKSYFEDWDFWLSILELGGTAHKLDELVFYYRIVKKSRFRSLTTEQTRISRKLLWENHKQLFAQYFMDPTDTFEYSSIKGSLQYRIGSKIVNVLKTIKGWLGNKSGV